MLAVGVDPPGHLRRRPQNTKLGRRLHQVLHALRHSPLVGLQRRPNMHFYDGCSKGCDIVCHRRRLKRQQQRFLSLSVCTNFNSMRNFPRCRRHTVLMRIASSARFICNNLCSGSAMQPEPLSRPLSWSVVMAAARAAVSLPSLWLLIAGMASEKKNRYWWLRGPRVNNGGCQLNRGHETIQMTRFAGQSLRASGIIVAIKPSRSCAA
jgi:hypothetical protein